MSTVSEYEAYVVEQRMAGNVISLADIIRKYLVNKQRAKLFNIEDHVYKEIGERFRSKEFNVKILQNLNYLITYDFVYFDAAENYYCIVLCKERT